MMTEPVGVEVMNGYAIVAFRTAGENERVILGARPDRYSRSGFEYVTAHAKPRSDQPREWFWGHYFLDLRTALADYEER